ncbi:MAG: hypothetical protein KDA60_19825 [Planctomycetales bacterium]|nr:hypothetical protein [Planctomycetales bacterium]
MSRTPKQSDRTWNLDDDIGQAKLGRLVDGELDSKQRRDLLDRIRQHPEGWKKCALAFLEDQAWRQDLSDSMTSIPHTSDESKSVGLAVVESSHEGWHTSIVVRRFAWAAVVLVAFGSGVFLRGLRMADTHSPPVAAVPPTDSRDEPTDSEPTRDDVSPPAPRQLTQAEVDRVLSRLGHRMQRRAGYVSITLDDGRDAVVPVEEIEIVPVYNPTY